MHKKLISIKIVAKALHNLIFSKMKLVLNFLRKESFVWDRIYLLIEYLFTQTVIFQKNKVMQLKFVSW